MFWFEEPLSDLRVPGTSQEVPAKGVEVTTCKQELTNKRENPTFLLVFINDFLSAAFYF